uniref:Uncharacterized protein n=1 Tax=Alexandrium monilatum TaxID=311494 RepID=A0A7S4QD68_9DINO
MDSLSAQPIHRSSLAAEEFEEDQSAGGETVDEGGADEDDAPPLELRERYVRPRFDGLLARLAKGDAACRAVLQDLYDRLKVSGRSVVVSSSVRTCTLDFTLAGMAGRYEQRSQADSTSAVWDLGSGGAFEPAPNLAAELVLDGDSLAGCEYFAASSKRGRRWTDEECVTNHFGSDNLKKLGGMGTLLQFLGAVCADCGAPYYAKHLPFGLPEALVRLEVDEEAEATARMLRAHRGDGRPAPAEPASPPAPKSRSTASVSAATPVAPSGGRRPSSRPPPGPGGTSPSAGAAGSMRASLSTTTLAPPSPTAPAGSKGGGRASPSPAKPRGDSSSRRPRGSNRGAA